MLRTVNNPIRLSHRPSVLLPAMLVLGLVLSFGASALAQPTPASSARPLTLSVGPRDGVWKRVFNPLLYEVDTRWPASAGIYEPLIVYNRATASYMPWLGIRYNWSADNKRLTFTLRSGVAWSDRTPFSARDVVFTFELLRRFPVLDRFKMWVFLTGVTAVNDTTVDFIFQRPFTPGLFSIGQLPIVPEHKWKAVANPATFDDPNPVGTGPFTEIVRFDAMAYELGRNPHYWQPGKPAVSSLRVPMYHSNQEIVKALEKSELDWASLFIPNIEKAYVAQDPARHAYWYPDFGNTTLLYLNTQKKPFDDKNVRKAISMAIDRQRIMTEALSGYAPPADATGLAESQKHWKNGTAQAAPWTLKNVVEANRLLDAAGLTRGADGIRTWPGGGRMRYDLHTVAGWSDWEAAASIIQQSLAEVGIAATAVPLPYQAWSDKLQKGRFDMGIWGSTRGPTPYQFYRGQMDATLVRPIGEDATDNFQRFASAEASPILRRFEVSSDPNELLALSGELEKTYVESAPSLPLFASPLWGVFNTSHFVGFPGRVRAYAGASPGQTDTLPALVEIAPRHNPS
jgi:peptide/nickel transport system substrate-binding protein